MQCPACFHQLTQLQVGNLFVDVCQGGCGGIWFDGFELQRVDEEHLELTDADFHDLRDTQTSRENYVAASQTTGIKRNRKRLLVARGEVVAISRLEDVVDE